MMEEELKQSNTKSICNKHSLQYEMYCKTCSELICKDCLVEHKDSHVCSKVEDYGKENLRKEFDELVKEVESSNDNIAPSECKALAGLLIRALTNLKVAVAENLTALTREIETLERLEVTAYALPNKEELLAILEQNLKTLEAELIKPGGFSKSLEGIKSAKELLKNLFEINTAFNKIKDEAMKVESELTLPNFVKELTQVRLDLGKLSTIDLTGLELEENNFITSRNVYGIKKLENELDVYNIDTKTITVLELPEEIPKEPSITQIVDKIYLTGGNDYLNTNIEFIEGTNQLVRKTNMKIGKKWHATVVLNTKEFVTIGGYNDAIKHLNGCDKYNIESDSWEELAHLNVKRQSTAACLFHRKEIYVFGGFSGNGSRTNSIEKLIINPMAREWIKIPTPTGESIPAFSCGIAAQVNGNEILILRGNKTVDTFYYNVLSNTVKKGADLKIRDSFLLQTLYPFDGSLAVFGYFGSVHLFNVRAQTWDDTQEVLDNY